MTQEEEIRSLLEAIGEAHAHTSVVTATKVARLARAALGTKEDWHDDKAG